MIQSVPIEDLHPDEENPRKPDEVRLALLRLSLQKLGFILPVHANAHGLILSGHQRHTVAESLGYESLPAELHDLTERQQHGINLLFNRATNDFNAFSTGSTAKEALSLEDLVQQAEEFEDYVDTYGEEWLAYDTEVSSIRGIAGGLSGQYDKKATHMARNLRRLGIQIPIVMTYSGRVLNGVYRLFAAREHGDTEWPIVQIPDDYGDLATSFLNFLSMDYHVNEQFADLLRYSAYRRVSNLRGSVPKAMRFWANGKKAKLDRDSYTKKYWTTFRETHGNTLLDFGAGLCRAKPFLERKGFQVTEFEPYRFDPTTNAGKPDPTYSKRMAREFLQEISDGNPFSTIFLASVLNSIPFPEDRMAVLLIVHSLSSLDSGVYGSCRDIVDFDYEYGGIRNANYFVFDSEPGVRLGDSLTRPKVQKFHSQDEMQRLLRMLWNKVETYPAGNVFFFEARAPKRVNPEALRQALAVEFENLPYADGTRMNLGREAIEAFNQRLAPRGIRL